MAVTSSLSGTLVHNSELIFTAGIYEAFHQRSCIRSDFSCTYFMLGLVEEASEVLEACRARAAVDDVVKECGDVLWYTTGLLRSNAVALSDIIGAPLPCTEGIPVEFEPEVQLVLSSGALAGRLKKFQSGAYEKDQLRSFICDLVRKILEALSSICTHRGRTLIHAAIANQNKIEKRLKSNMIKGDGSNREDNPRDHRDSSGNLPFC